MMIEAVNSYTEARETLEITPEGLAAVLKGKKIPVGMRSYPGWTGELEFLLFRCPGCGGLRVDYRHHYAPHQYLMCPNEKKVIRG